MSKLTFLKYEKPLLTAMILCSTAEECIEKIKASEADGAEAYGIQLCFLKKEYRTEEILKKIFEACNGKPIYITSYRHKESVDLTDDERVELLLLGLKCGATLCDVMGDLYAQAPYELTYDENAVQKQKELIAQIHKCGGEVLMSSHTSAKLTVEETLKIAIEQADRGADITKIVNDIDGEEDIPECIRTILGLKTIGKNFLYLVRGTGAKMIRQTGPNLGVCMYLCVQYHGPFDNASQPILKKIKAVRENLDL